MLTTGSARHIASPTIIKPSLSSTPWLTSPIGKTTIPICRFITTASWCRSRRTTLAVSRSTIASARPRSKSFLGPSLKGLVTATHRRHCAVLLDDGRSVSCLYRGRHLALACGDRVQLSLIGDEGVIEE